MMWCTVRTLVVPNLEGRMVCLVLFTRADLMSQGAVSKDGNRLPVPNLTVLDIACHAFRQVVSQQQIQSLMEANPEALLLKSAQGFANSLRACLRQPFEKGLCFRKRARL